MANMVMTKTPMPEQEPDVRNRNFKEVALGYTEEMAVFEAQRCLHCKNRPCVSGCPVNVPIPEFIGHVANGDFEAAYRVLSSQTPCPPYAEGYVRRKPSANRNVCAASRASRSVSAGLSALSRTGIWQT